MTILSSFSIQKGGPPVKKQWIVFGAIVVFLFAAAFSLWLEKPPPPTYGEQPLQP